MVRKLTMLPYEFVVRGYLFGSMWRAYDAGEPFCGIVLPKGYRLAQKLEQPILILDEATSALDNESEYAVAKSLNELAKGRTTLTIAHRLSSIRNSDRILVLTDEGIVEEGDHEELMALGGIYHHFYTMANEIK